MSKKLKVLIFIIFVSFAGFLFFNDYSFAQEQCRLYRAFWSKLVLNIEEMVRMTVDGVNCRDWTVSLNIYEDDGLVGDDFLGTIETRFNNSSRATTNFVFTQANYQLGDDALEGLSEEIYFEAVVGVGAAKSKVTSGNLTLNKIATSGSGPGAPGGPGPGAPGGPGPGQPGQPQTVTFNIENQIAAESLVDLAKAIGRFLFQIAIPIAVIVIIYAGLLFLTSGGKQEQVTKARKALWYAVIGLAIILIGQGFFTLIKSILNLGTP